VRTNIDIDDQLVQQAMRKFPTVRGWTDPFELLSVEVLVG
jgi:Bacterial antitoxin of type II TA system, VapB